MKVYNTLTGKKEEFITREANKVGMYVCGVTVYDYCHVGHARAYLSFDAIHRYLSYKGYDVTYVRNFTDVDDKIIKRSQEAGIEINELTEKYIEAFYKDMRALKIKDATIEPKATEHIEDMIKLIEELIKNGYAYESDGDVYYAVEKFTTYGKLSGRNIEDMIAGVRITVSDKKRSPLDFALWKKVKEGEKTWDSPWGPGRPGWHIECSAMSTKYLGHTFDIHGGGKDLVFPHHENEIAQTEGATGHQYVKYWMHNGFVNIDGTKMSKSLGNFFTIGNLLENYDPEVIRFFVLLNHYRSPINFKVEKYQDNSGNDKIRFVSLDNAEDRLYNIYDTIEKMTQIVEADGKLGVNLNEEFTSSILTKFEEAMDDDFNTAAALGEFSKVIRFINDIINKPKTKMKNKKATLVEVLPQVKIIASILAIFEQKPQDYISNVTDKRLTLKGLSKEMILSKIEDRNMAKADKNYDLSDQIRDELLNMGVLIQDTANGTVWRLK